MFNFKKILMDKFNNFNKFNNFRIKEYNREDYTTKKSDIRFFYEGKVINIKDLKI